MELNQPDKAMEYVKLDAGSEWAAQSTALILLHQGKVSEARQTIQKVSPNLLMGRDLLRACLDPEQTSTLKQIAQKTEAATMADTDGEPRFLVGTLQGFAVKEKRRCGWYAVPSLNTTIAPTLPCKPTRCLQICGMAPSSAICSPLPKPATIVFWLAAIRVCSEHLIISNFEIRAYWTLLLQAFARTRLLKPEIYQ